MSTNPKIHDSETLAKGLQTITPSALIHHKFKGVDNVLLTRRSENKKFLPGVYEIPGGHIDYGEDLVEGLIREIFEETNLAIKLGDPFFAFTYENEIKQSQAVEIIFFATILGSVDDIKLVPEDHSEYRWFAEEEINQVIESGKDPNDPEIEALYKAFALLKGKQPDFGD